MPAASHPHSPTPEEIMAYLDGETPPADRAAIEAHLAACKECEMVADTFRRVTQQAADWTVEPAPAMRVPDGPAGPPQRARLLSWRPSRVALAGLTAAAAVLLVISLGNNTKRPPTIDAAMPARAAKGSTLTRDAGGQVGRIAGRAELSQANAPASPQTFMQDSRTQALRTPAVIRTASLHVVAKEFNGVRATVEALVAQAGGFIDHMTVTGDTSTARTLAGTLRVPGDRLPDVLTRLRQLGQVAEDTQGSQDVTDQIVDLDARLASARATERRLTDLLRNRTGKLSDVLEVERELTRVRLDIERLDAEKTNVGRRVSYATIGLTVTEERKAGLDAGPLSLATRIRVATADGLEAALESVALMLLFLLRAGPTLLLWGTVAAIVWTFGRRLRRPSAEN